MVNFLTEEHKLSNKKEEKRINETSGGLIINNRIGGNLMVTWCLGDFDMKKYGLISSPEIKEFFIDKNSIIVVASDGIWD